MEEWRINFQCICLSFGHISQDLQSANGIIIIGTLKCLSIGTPKIINFPFVSNGKLMVITRPGVQANHNEAVLGLNFVTPENNEFSIWNKWKIYCF